MGWDKLRISIPMLTSGPITFAWNRSLMLLERPLPMLKVGDYVRLICRCSPKCRYHANRKTLFIVYEAEEWGAKIKFRNGKTLYNGTTFYELALVPEPFLGLVAEALPKKSRRKRVKG